MIATQPVEGVGPLARGRSRITAKAAAALLEQGLWSVFLFLAVGGASELGGAPERVGWLVADGFALWAIATRPRLYATLAVRTAPMLSWGILACASALWSLSPEVSIYHGVQLVLTLLVGGVAAVRLGLAGLTRVVFVGLGAATTLSVAAVLAGEMRPFGSDGAWQGLFDHKNVLGAVAVAWLAAALALTIDRFRPIPAAAALLAVLVVVETRSATSIVATMAVLGLFVALAAARAGLRRTALALAGATVLAGALALFVVLARIDLVRLYVDASGKDLTLTGRTILWRFGLEAFGQRPLGGYGFKGYWESAATTSAYLHHYLGQRLWHFHNTYVEVAVAFGAIGLVLLAWGLASAVLRIARVAARTGSGGFWALALLVHVLSLSLAENPLVQNHSVWQALLFAAYAAATLARPARLAPVGAASGGAPR